MLIQSKNIIGGGDIWAPDANGAVQEQPITTTNAYVEFTGVPAVAGYGYEVFIDMDYAATPGTDAPKQLGKLAFTLVNGTYTVRCNFSTTPTAAQAGGKCRLRIYR